MLQDIVIRGCNTPSVKVKREGGRDLGRWILTEAFLIIMVKLKA
jgi:hypothetical protein